MTFRLNKPFPGFSCQKVRQPFWVLQKVLTNKIGPFMFVVPIIVQDFVAKSMLFFMKVEIAKRKSLINSHLIIKLLNGVAINPSKSQRLHSICQIVLEMSNWTIDSLHNQKQNYSEIIFEKSFIFVFIASFKWSEETTQYSL